MSLVLLLVAFALDTRRTEAVAPLLLHYKGERSALAISSVSVAPGEVLTVRVSDGPSGATYVAEGAGMRAAPSGTAWTWTAPNRSGLHQLRIVRDGGAETRTLNVFVLVPFSHIRGEHLNGYRIGRYPERPLHGLAIYEQPVGFVEVTRENENTLVTPHFRLKDFVCKQGGGYPRYVVLDERLLLKLEYLLDHVREAGYPTAAFRVMSGYRTPYYNKAIGNVQYSRHVWGAAADIFIDEDGDGEMDDLNGDGKVDANDAQVLYDLVDGQVEKAEYRRFRGGLGKYHRTQSHGPFVHVDVRDRIARW
jgi:hypothetical protein